MEIEGKSGDGNLILQMLHKVEDVTKRDEDVKLASEADGKLCILGMGSFPTRAFELEPKEKDMNKVKGQNLHEEDENREFSSDPDHVVDNQNLGFFIHDRYALTQKLQSTYLNILAQPIPEQKSI